MTRAWSVDFATFVMLIYIGVLLYLFFPDSFWLAAIAASAITAMFFYVFSVKPTRESEPLAFKHPSLALPNLEYRTHPSFSFFAAKYMGKNYVMVPEWRADFDISDNEPMIFHEFAHLRRGDTFAFTWLYPFVAVFSFCFVLLAVGAFNQTPQLQLLQFIERISDEPDDPLEEFRLLFFLAIAVLPAFPLAQMLLLMRDREYGADRHAHNLLGERYATFISDCAEQDRTAQTGIAFKDQWRAIANAILHPTFSQRDKAIRHPFSYTELLGFWSGLHFSAILAFSTIISVIFAIELIMRAGEMLGVDIFYFASGHPASFVFVIAVIGPLLLAVAVHGSMIVQNTVLQVGSRNALFRLLPHILATTGVYILVALMLNYAFDGNIRAEEGWLFDFRRTAVVTGIFYIILWAFWSCIAKRAQESKLAFLVHCALATTAVALAAPLTMILVPSLH